jgi:hypothetical protein
VVVTRVGNVVASLRHAIFGSRCCSIAVSFGVTAHSSRNANMAIVSARPAKKRKFMASLRRAFGSAGRSAADRTWDRHWKT